MDINTTPIQSNITEELSSDSSASSNSSSISTSSDYENYIIKANVCKILSKEFDLPEMIFDETDIDEPPKEHGLSNADVIIPAYYYHKHPSKIFDIDFYKIIKDDIKNCRPLNKYQLEYIKEIKEEYKYELIENLNECLKLFSEYMK